MRQTGILMAVSSLPSPYGIGDFGSSSFEFIDMIKEADVRIWQILPFNRLGYGNSPYQAYSSIAGDEIYISLDLLVQDDLLKREELKQFNAEAKYVDYDQVRQYKEALFKKAFIEFKNSYLRFKDNYESFIEKNTWVYNYSVFVALKKANELKCWTEWPTSHKNWIKDKVLDLSIYNEEIEFQQFLQFIFFKQWHEVKNYANYAGITIMGDIPYYVGIDSIDCWENQQYFLLDSDGRPSFIAGVPPDYFSVTGQRWGNPIYNWEKIQEDQFSFWVNRLGLNADVFDVIRIDHFRAFDTYWKIPSTCPTAMEGEWVEAPGYAFFDELFKVYPNMKVVAEDLGDLRPEVGQLRDHYEFAGMKIVQFTFDPNETNNDFEDRKNMIIYTGTHDNQTILGWYLDQPEDVQQSTVNYLNQQGFSGELSEMMCEYALSSIADTAIIPTQDLLGLDDHARMNVPGTIGSPNWEWKLVDFNDLKDRLIEFKKMIKKHKRVV